MFALGTRRNDAILVQSCIAGQTPGRTWRGGNGNRADKTVGVQSGNHILTQRLLSPEQMRAAGNVQHQAGLPINDVDRQQRGVTLAPVGNAFQQRCIGSFIGFMTVQFWQDRPCIGQGLVLMKPGLPGRRIQGRQAQCTFNGGNDGKRRAISLSAPTVLEAPRLAPYLTADPVGWQIGKRDAQEALSVIACLTLTLHGGGFRIGHG